MMPVTVFCGAGVDVMPDQDVSTSKIILCLTRQRTLVAPQTHKTIHPVCAVLLRIVWLDSSLQILAISQANNQTTGVRCYHCCRLQCCQNVLHTSLSLLRANCRKPASSAVDRLSQSSVPSCTLFTVFNDWRHTNMSKECENRANIRDDLQHTYTLFAMLDP